MIRVPTHRPPTHPGEMLLAEFLEPMGLTQKQLADEIYVPYQRINEIINGKRGITPSTALRLAKFFNISSDFWLNLQIRWDLYYAQQSEEETVKKFEYINCDLLLSQMNFQNVYSSRLNIWSTANGKSGKVGEIMKSVLRNRCSSYSPSTKVQTVKVGSLTEPM
jgi:antitoxin HigA-1